MNRQKTICLAIALILIVGCVDAKDNKTGINDNPVTVATTMPVTLYTQAEVDAAVMAALQNVENQQKAQSGRDTYQINNTVAGSGGVFLMLVVVVLGWKLFNSNKALHAVTSAIESLGHSAKTTVRYEAVAIGAEKYLRSKVKKWYKPTF